MICPLRSVFDTIKVVSCSSISRWVTACLFSSQTPPRPDNSSQWLIKYSELFPFGFRQIGRPRLHLGSGALTRAPLSPAAPRSGSVDTLPRTKGTDAGTELVTGAPSQLRFMLRISWIVSSDSTEKIIEQQAPRPGLVTTQLGADNLPGTSMEIRVLATQAGIVRVVRVTLAFTMDPATEHAFVIARHHRRIQGLTFAGQKLRSLCFQPMWAWMTPSKSNDAGAATSLCATVDRRTGPRTAPTRRPGPAGSPPRQPPPRPAPRSAASPRPSGPPPASPAQSRPLCSWLASEISVTSVDSFWKFDTTSSIVCPASLTSRAPSSTLSTLSAISALISRAACALRCARLRTSLATTAKPRPLLARPRRFHRCVQCQDVRLERDRVDHPDDVRDLLRALLDRAHRVHHPRPPSLRPAPPPRCSNSPVPAPDARYPRSACTVAFSCSIELAVSSRLLACSSVRADRSELPAEISCAATLIDSARLP